MAQNKILIFQQSSEYSSTPDVINREKLISRDDS